MEARPAASSAVCRASGQCRRWDRGSLPYTADCIRRQTGVAGQGRRRSESRPALYGTAARPPAVAGQSRPCPLSDGTPPPGRWQPVPPAPPLGLSRARQLAARRQRRPTAVSRRRRQQQCVWVCGRKESVMRPTGRPRRVLSIQLMEASDVTDGGGGGAGHWRGPLVQGAVSGWVTLSWG